ncbi:MAG: YHS domain-containing (seleno)protein [Ginsengibacter sp.]
MKTISTSMQLKQLLREKADKDKVLKILLAAGLVFLFVFMAATVNAQKYQGKFYNNVDANGIILNGYDPVAFFTDNRPVKGKSSFSFKYEDAVYNVASQEHLDLFKNNPEKYKPQFGAWCAYAVSLGRVAPIDVNTFSIVNGRLVIQHNQKAVRGWNEDVQGNLKLADKYWPKVTANGGKQIHTRAEIQMILWISLAVLILLGIIFLAVKKSRKSSLTKILKNKTYSKNQWGYEQPVARQKM